MKPTRCTLLRSIFISTSLHVSGNYAPIIRGAYCTYATLVFFTLYGWLSGSAGWDKTAVLSQPADQTATHFFCGAAAQRGPWPPHAGGFYITHNDASQSVGRLLTSDQLVAETST